MSVNLNGDRGGFFVVALDTSTFVSFDLEKRAVRFRSGHGLRACVLSRVPGSVTHPTGRGKPMGGRTGSARAARTKCRALGDLNTEIYFLPMVEPLFLVCSRSSSHCVLTWWRGEGGGRASSQLALLAGHLSHPEGPHPHGLIISQRPHLPVPSYGRAGRRHRNPGEPVSLGTVQSRAILFTCGGCLGLTRIGTEGLLPWSRPGTQRGCHDSSVTDLL